MPDRPRGAIAFPYGACREGRGVQGSGRRPRLPRDRRLRLPVGLPYGRPGCLGRDGGVDVPAPLRLTQHLRRPARSRRRRVAPGPNGPAGAGGAPLRPRHERLGDELDDAHGVVRRPRRPDARARERRGRHRRARSQPRPPRRRTSARPDSRVRARRGRGGDDLRARLRLRHRAHELDARGQGPPGRRRQRRRGSPFACSATSRWISTAPARAEFARSGRGSGASRACHGGRSSAARATPPTQSAGSTPRSSSGAAGWRGGRFRITRGAGRSSARRWRSRG